MRRTVFFCLTALSCTLVSGSAMAGPHTQAIYDACKANAGDQANEAYCRCFADGMSGKSEADQQFFLDVVSVSGDDSEQQMQALLTRLNMTQEQFDQRMGEVSPHFDEVDAACTPNSGAGSGSAPTPPTAPEAPQAPADAPPAPAGQ